MSPLLSYLTPAPTSSRPDRATVLNEQGTVQTSLDYGFLGTGAGRQKNVSTHVVTNHTAASSAGTTYTVYNLQITSNGVSSCSVVYLTLTSVVGATAKFSITTENWGTLIPYLTVAGIDFQQHLSISNIAVAFDAFKARKKTPYSRSTTTGSYAMTGLLKVGLIPAQARIVMRAKLGQFLLKECKLQGEADYGDLVMEASQRVNVTGINTTMLLRDLRHPWELVPKLKNLRSLKGIADTYLTINYGILPTISDLRSIFGAFKKLMPRRDRQGNENFYASRTTLDVVDSAVIKVEQHVKLSVGKEDDALDSLMMGFERVGLLPNFVTLWDLIPYSFCVDWLIDVGDFLERVDTRQRLLRFNVSYVTMSRKQTVDLTVTPTQEFPVSGALSLVRYHRWVTIKAPVPPLSLQPSHQGFDHWIESTALLIQRKKYRR